jgi:hypothetical protein
LDLQCGASRVALAYGYHHAAPVHHSGGSTRCKHLAPSGPQQVVDDYCVCPPPQSHWLVGVRVQPVAKACKLGANEGEKILKTPITASAFIGFALAGVALAQQMNANEGFAAHTASQPYDIETFGVFGDMMLKGEFSPKVKLDDAMVKHPSTGVGAVADARGEITIYHGTLILSYGKPGAHPVRGMESAALLAMGAAKDWQTISVERDVPPEEVEAFIAASAKAHGIDADKSFPFELHGTIAPYVMHVNAAPIDGPHGMGLPMAITVVREGLEIVGNIAGLYVALGLVGIATHGGERTHSHWVSEDAASTAHLDRWGIKAGSTLLLPK